MQKKLEERLLQHKMSMHAKSREKWEVQESLQVVTQFMEKRKQ